MRAKGGLALPDVQIRSGRTGQTYIANAPGYGALFAGGGGLVGLALDTEVHDVVAADGAVVDDNVPGPEGDGVPLLHLEALLAFVGAGLGCLGLCSGCWGVCHLHVGHYGSCEGGAGLGVMEGVVGGAEALRELPETVCGGGEGDVLMYGAGFGDYQACCVRDWCW
jgi:hypothetical protein